MTPIRVLHVTPDLVPYGLENMIAGLVRTLAAGAFESAIVSLYPECAGGLEPELRAAGIGLYHLGKRRGLDVRMYPRLTRVIREFRPHVLHTHNYVLRYAYPAACLTRVPAIVHTVHNVADREVDRAGLALQRFAFRHGVAPVTIAGEVSASFQRTYGYSEAALIPNAIDVDRYSRPKVPRDAWRRQLGIGPEIFAYLCVARFSEQKDHATLLRAFAQGPAQLPDARLLLAGDGALRPQVEQLIRSLNIESRVIFLGRRSDMPETLNAADVFVLGSRWEGNPLSVMEAMAAAKPVIATTVGAIPELVRHGVDGFLSAPGDISGLAQSMLQIRREGSAVTLARAAAARAQERFGLAGMARAYSDLYRRVISRQGRMPGRAANNCTGGSWENPRSRSIR